MCSLILSPDEEAYITFVGLRRGDQESCVSMWEIEKDEGQW